MSIYETYDPRFGALIQSSAHLDHLGTGLRWAEGPVWFPAHQALYLSDIPNDRIMRWTEGTGLSVFRSPAGYTNGHTRDREGRLVSCSHGTRSLIRTEHDGTLTTLAESYGGRWLNSPNDVVVTRDGAVWFSDPTYGILSDYEGYESVPEQDTNAVYRLAPGGREPERMIAGFVQPNGLAFSPDESRLYVAESGSSHDASVPSVLRVFEIRDGQVDQGRVFAQVEPGPPDGLRIDARGHVWCSAADGVQVFHPDGTLLGKILVPERVANLCFGGPRGNRLFLAATTSLYAVFVNARGAA
ncbi:SMP-30/gluconolactonase/LRE family protein [Rubellimicrobium rubrum]|uniref:SMP-30/gluconolactonase/LRE family protein n=1 Tax=Rubellimicrobium rubrum TaxID=2585369 RepID=A0A5C4N7E8_9RHOB|nr:SMP-30/gluconolactonase/LRE family protein [Rubellimicrobium rubrum]TNC52981.1 SMP-30/gluconolactonase/LRE family protein [Rubellimicrobium rubrum]